MISLSSSKKVAFKTYKKVQYVDFREYYTKDGKQHPGKKGLMLTVDVYRALKKLIPEVDKALTDF